MFGFLVLSCFYAKGGKIMSERKTDKREKEFADEIPDEEESFPEPYEKTWRDDSAQHECAPEE